MNYPEHPRWLSILPHPEGLKNLTRLLGHSLLPGSCLLCADDSLDQLLCPDCLANLPSLPGARCPICADQTTHGERCGACLRETPFFERSIALYRYDFPVDRIIHALKYGHCLPVADWCGRRLAEVRAGEGCDAIIPMPLHRDRLRERGFNQSAEIAKTLGKLMNIPVERDLIVRNRATAPQAELAFKMRQKNVRGAFECFRDFSGRHLLLVDDVMTTGATANECARSLKRHGAASVSLAIVARALKH